ncbi:MAG TPA: DUF3515 family protein [Actinoplanes sp.]|nr:DUF3515 family protein [Actinoplanes sp.]
MVDQLSRPQSPGPDPQVGGTDRSTRSAALWAAAVALPIAVLSAVLIFSQLSAEVSPAAPTPTATTPALGSTAPVAMAAPKLSARAEVLCRALTSQLPAAVRHLAARPVTAGPEQNAAWGDPALRLACGVAAPRVAPEAMLMTMDGVCWHSEQRAGASVWTTVDREVAVQVTVPGQYAAPAQWTNEFSTTVVATVPSVKKVPSGCA